MFLAADCIHLYVPTLEEGLEFYQHKLGHRLFWRDGAYVGLLMDASKTELVISPKDEPLTKGEVDILVKDAAGDAEAFRQAGGKLLCPPIELPVGCCAPVEDPFGNRYTLIDLHKGLYQTDESGQVTGVAKPPIYPLERVQGSFTVCKLQAGTPVAMDTSFTFLSQTDGELSLVCPATAIPASGVLAIESGYAALRVKGSLEFSLTGILAGITAALAQRGVPVFAISTFDTDYILIKEESLSRATIALEQAGYPLHAL